MGCSNTREDIEDQIMLIRLKRMNIQIEKEKQLKILSEIEGKKITIDNFPNYLVAIHKGMKINEINLEQMNIISEKDDNNNNNNNEECQEEKSVPPKNDNVSEGGKIILSPSVDNNEKNEINNQIEEKKENNISPIEINIDLNNNIVQNEKDFKKDLIKRKKIIVKKKIKKKKIKKSSLGNINNNVTNNILNDENNNNIQNDINNNINNINIKNDINNNNEQNASP